MLCIQKIFHPGNSFFLFLDRQIYDEIKSIEKEEDYQKEEKHESIKSNNSIIQFDIFLISNICRVCYFKNFSQVE